VANSRNDKPFSQTNWDAGDEAKSHLRNRHWDVAVEVFTDKIPFEGQKNEAVILCIARELTGYAKERSGSRTYR